MDPRDIYRKFQKIAASDGAVTDSAERARLDVGLPKLAVLTKVAMGAVLRGAGRASKVLTQRGGARAAARRSAYRKLPVKEKGLPTSRAQQPQMQRGDVPEAVEALGSAARGSAPASALPRQPQLGMRGSPEAAAVPGAAGGRNWGRGLWAVPALGLGAYGLSQVGALPGQLAGGGGGGGGGMMGMTPQAAPMMDAQTRRYYEMMQMAQQQGYPVY